MSDQCARDSAGNLLDASQIDFYESESDEKALPAVIGLLAVTHATDYPLIFCAFVVPPRRGDRKRHTDKLTASLLVEQEDKDGHAPIRRAPRATRTTSTRVKAVPESIREEEDEDFAMPDLKDVSDSEDSDSEDEQGVDNDEIADLLPSKTVPARGGVPSSKPQTRTSGSGGKRKQATESASAPPAKKAMRATAVEVEDEGDTPKTTQFKNPIYMFYDIGGRVGWAGTSPEIACSSLFSPKCRRRAQMNVPSCAELGNASHSGSAPQHELRPAFPTHHFHLPPCCGRLNDLQLSWSSRSHASHGRLERQRRATTPTEVLELRSLVARAPRVPWPARASATRTPFRSDFLDVPTHTRSLGASSDNARLTRATNPSGAANTLETPTRVLGGRRRVGIHVAYLPSFFPSPIVKRGNNVLLSPPASYDCPRRAGEFGASFGRPRIDELQGVSTRAVPAEDTSLSGADACTTFRLTLRTSHALRSWRGGRRTIYLVREPGPTDRFSDQIVRNPSDLHKFRKTVRISDTEDGAAEKITVNSNAAQKE
ncbi:hypothetical protein DFH09DRAFT_1089269 [Mycena vulgaris]|nr:hypothetical protein DFH09DRAFT_1089269 [Mycena vulgaris]